MKINKICLITVILTCAINSSLFAQQDATNNKNNKTKLKADLGIIFFNSTSNLYAYGKEEIKDNTKEGEATNTALMFPLIDFSYTFNESQTKLFFGTPLDSSSIALSMGVSQPIDKIGEFSISLAPGLGVEVWKNPYLENTKREKSPVSQYTINFTWERIINSPLNLSYSYQHLDIEDDEIGELYEDLKRNGSAESVQLTCDIGLSKTSILIPGLFLEESQLEGAANNYNKAGLTMTYKKLNREYFLMLIMEASAVSYDEEHPIYMETREDKEVGAFALLNFPKLFDTESVHSNLIIGAEAVNSNIDFFDSKTSYLAITLGYDF